MIRVKVLLIYIYIYIYIYIEEHLNPAVVHVFEASHGQW